jgi:hypothetical protein
MTEDPPGNHRHKSCILKGQGNHENVASQDGRAHCSCRRSCLYVDGRPSAGSHLTLLAGSECPGRAQDCDRRAAQLQSGRQGNRCSQISYDHGAMIVTLSVRGLHVSPDFTCPAGDFCFFTKIDLKGNGYAADPALYSKQTYYSIHTWYPSANLGSVHNRWSERVFISRNNPPGSGPNLCYPPTGTGSPNEDLNWVYFATSAC